MISDRALSVEGPGSTPVRGENISGSKHAQLIREDKTFCCPSDEDPVQVKDATILRQNHSLVVHLAKLLDPLVPCGLWLNTTNCRMKERHTMCTGI